MQDKNKILIRFSINLRKFRKERNLTQMEVSTYLNIPRSVYMRYESVNDVPDIKLSSLVKLAKYFNKSIDDFLK